MRQVYETREDMREKELRQKTMHHNQTKTYETRIVKD